ncbi:MAG: M20 family metallopeptidase, partial [Anaerolineaceae bacterium]|nr:M20 family metallopeptidase [Anaerolineaceae bacterium]
MRFLPVQHFQDSLPYVRSLLEELVIIESPSSNKAAVDAQALRIIQELETLGGTISIYPQEQAGSNILCRWGSRDLESGAGGILVLMHMDTVYDVGTLDIQPLHEVDGKLFGPGVLDMKASIAMFLGMIREFQQQNLWPTRPITALFTADEESGSQTSRALIESEASQAGIVFCLEFPLANGALKTARKGTGEIDLSVKGVAAHAGVNHDQGRNAIEELAHHILAIQQLTDYSRGTTLNVGVVRGGTRSNVVPNEAHARVDLRVSSLEEFHRLQEWVKNRQPVIDGTTLLASIQLNRPPMPRDAKMEETFRKARSIAAGLGMDLTEGSTGGGSDANFVAPLGVPVLD